MRDKVTFDSNVPAVVALEFDDGVLKPSINGRDEYQYFCHGDRIMWVSADVREKIIASGAKAGDTVEITKRETRQGMQRRIIWQVERPTASAETEPEQQPPQQRRQTNGTPMDRPYPSKAELDAARAAITPANGNGKGMDAATAAAQTAPPGWTAQQLKPQQAQPRSHADLMLRSVTDAIDVAVLAERYAQEKGKQLNLTSDDVRAIGNSIYISRTR